MAEIDLQNLEDKIKVIDSDIQKVNDRLYSSETATYLRNPF